MRRFVKHGVTILTGGLALMLFAACPSPQGPTTPGPPGCIEEIPGVFSSWLFDGADPSGGCHCPTTFDDKDPRKVECEYEQRLVLCLTQNGATFDCKNPPQLAVVSQKNAGKPDGPTFDSVNFNAFLPGNCQAQSTVSDCVQRLNTQDGPYASPPVSARTAMHCNAALDPCGGKGDTNDVWDPCTTKACVPQ